VQLAYSAYKEGYIHTTKVMSVPDLHLPNKPRARREGRRLVQDGDFCLGDTDALADSYSPRSLDPSFSFLRECTSRARSDPAQKQFLPRLSTTTLCFKHRSAAPVRARERARRKWRTFRDWRAIYISID
jgi:hypothetical protein